jgi:hypothetical protein
MYGVIAFANSFILIILKLLFGFARNTKKSPPVSFLLCDSMTSQSFPCEEAFRRCVSSLSRVRRALDGNALRRLFGSKKKQKNKKWQDAIRKRMEITSMNRYIIIYYSDLPGTSQESFPNGRKFQVSEIL